MKFFKYKTFGDFKMFLSSLESGRHDGVVAPGLGRAVPGSALFLRICKQRESRQAVPRRFTARRRDNLKKNSDFLNCKCQFLDEIQYKKNR